MDKKLQDYLAGLTSKKLHSSDNMLIHSAGKKNNSKFSRTMQRVAKERNQDPEYLESLRNGIANRDNTYQVESNAKPEVKAKISKSLKGKAKTEEHKQALKSTTTNRYGNADYESAHKTGLAKRDKPFHAGEYGTFPSRADAARYAASQGLPNAVKKLEAWTKTKPTEYYFVV